MKSLKTRLDSLAGQPYQAIQKLKGLFHFPQYDFHFIRIQGSPGANPASIAAINCSIAASEIPQSFFHSPYSRLAVADFLIRRFNQTISQFAAQNRGRDGSGSFHTIELSQKMLERDSVLFSKQGIELRFIFSLPCKNTRSGQFDAEQTWIMFDQELQRIVEYSLFYKNYDKATKRLLQKYVEIQNTRQQIKDYLAENGYCAFINNGACLPRRSGVDDKPVASNKITRFQSPPSLQIDIPLADNKQIQGMAIKYGISCITGGGYHGKSTLLQAILMGVYAHIPGDGREYVVTREDAFFVRAEQGRSIKNVDISSFIGLLPNGISTRQFSTDNASGSTSQAASIVEAVQSGSDLLLFDEDSSASNFLIRDELIKTVLGSAADPIKPLYSSVRSIWQQHAVSMIFVVGGLGAFLQKADLCLHMENYQCQDITAKVREKLGEIDEDEYFPLNFSSQRKLSPDNFDPSYTNKRLQKKIAQRIKPLRNAPRQLEYGMDLIKLEALPHIAESPQVLSVGYCLLQIRGAMREQGSEQQEINYWLNWLYKKLEKQGLAFLEPDYPGLQSLPRKYEVAAAINRIRSLKIAE